MKVYIHVIPNYTFFSTTNNIESDIAVAVFDTEKNSVSINTEAFLETIREFTKTDENCCFHEWESVYDGYSHETGHRNYDRCKICGRVERQ